MPQDLLVRLYDLPSPEPETEVTHGPAFKVRRALPIDKHIVVSYVREEFLEAWASECEMAFSHQPPRCFVAVREEKLVGFACYDATCWDFFGPLGVSEAFRRRGIGTALVRASLAAMWTEGYAYAVIGWVADDGGTGPRGRWSTAHLDGWLPASGNAAPCVTLAILKPPRNIVSQPPLVGCAPMNLSVWTDMRISGGVLRGTGYSESGSGRSSN